MKLELAQKLVNILLKNNYTVDGKTFNLSKCGWFFKGFDRSVNRLGICSWGIKGKYIALSKKMTENRTKEEVEQTILHEIAHAIDVEIRGKSPHDNVWKNISMQIGYNGKRTIVVNSTIEQKIVIYKWVAICEEHGILGGWSRKPTRGKICKRCRKSILIVPVTDERVKKLVKNLTKTV